MWPAPPRMLSERIGVGLHSVPGGHSWAWSVLLCPFLNTVVTVDFGVCLMGGL